jgi:hypothetical protein
LVGLTREQIACFNWEVGVQIPTVRPVVDAAVKHAEELRNQIQALSASDDTDEKSRLLREAEDALDNVRLIGDLAIAAFFRAEKKKDREQLRSTYETKVRNFITAADGNGSVTKQELHSLVQDTLEGEKPIRPFHWGLEFPEVFSRRSPGFDAFVGNPPFLGGKRISGFLGPAYRDWLPTIHPSASRNTDLCAHFFRRTFDLLQEKGTAGLVATNTIAQGETRDGGLLWISVHGGTIYAAYRRHEWPGMAAVITSIVHFSRAQVHGPQLLDGKQVEKITAYLFHTGDDSEPCQLGANKGKSFIGSYVLGKGFLFDDTDPDATPISEMRRLITQDARNKQRIFPYLGGEELNESPNQAHKRYVINFFDLSEEEAALWPDLLGILRAKVKPQRVAQNRAAYSKYWWQFAEKHPELQNRISKLRRVIVLSRVSSTFGFVLVPTGPVFNEKIVIFPEDSLSTFCVLQARIHETWARFFSSTLKDDLQYTPSKCCETFPFCARSADEDLERAATPYHDFRAAVMLRNSEGLTKTYNRFHNPEERDPDIIKLRELHDAMDRAVLDAYGWTDLKPTCEFILDYEEEENDDGKLRKKKKPWRYRWPDEFRDEVLARLLALNQERAAQEKIMSVAADGAKTKKGVKRRKPSSSSTDTLFD